MRKIFALLAFYFLFISQSFAVVGIPNSTHWEPAGFGGGGTYSMIVPDHFTANKIYAVPDVNAPYVSTDAGENWNFLSTVGGVNSGFTPTQTAAIVQSKNNANLLYAIDSANNGGLVRSIDGGQYWTKVGSYKNGKGNKSIVIDPNDDDTVYVASQANGTLQGGRIYRSTNGGTSFAELFRPFDVSVTSESAELNGTGQNRTGQLNNKNNIFKGSVVFTSGSGETFTDNGSGVLVSNMGGSGTITYTNVSSTSYGNYSLTFGTTPSTTTVSYTVSYSPSWVYVTDDGEDLFVGRSASSGTALVRYNIAGETITPITLTGTNATYINDYDTYIDGSSVENLCVSAGYKIACTADKGDSWTYTAAVTTGTTYYISRFAVRRKTDTTLTFVITRQLISNVYTTAHQYSTNGGTTWSNVSISENETMNPTQVFTTGSKNVKSIVADPNDEEVFYLTTDWLISRSDDGGATFAEKDHGAQNIVATDIAVAPNGRWFQTSMDTGIQYSDDKGVTWVQGIPNATQPFVNSSTDSMGGHYWRVKTFGTPTEWQNSQGKVVVTATMYGNNNAIYYKNAVIYSHDSGATWARSLTGLPTAGLYGDIIWDHGYSRAIGANADGSVIHIGMDGENCNADGTGPLASDNCSTATYGTAAYNHTFGGLFRSTDYGVTWQQIWYTPRKIYNALAVDPTDLTGRTLMFGTFGYNLYQKTQISETAELTGEGSTRTGTLNKTSGIIAGSITFTDAGGEIFTDSYTELGTNTLTSNMGGSGTINYSTREYSLTYGTTPSSATVSYGWKAYVGDSNGPGNYVYDVAYDSRGRPYAVTSSSGGELHRSVNTTYGDGSGQWGTWQRMKKFSSSGIADGLIIDPQNDNRIFVSMTLGNVSDRRIWVTNNADQHTNATWYDITGDFPVVGGCQALDIDYSDGAQGHLLCASNGAGVWKLNLQDSISSNPGRTNFGGSSGTFASGIPFSREWNNAGFGGGGAYMNVAVDLEYSNILYIISDVSGFFKSSSGGDDWEFSQVGTTSILNSYFVQAPSNPDVIYMLGRNIAKSVNRARSWSTLASVVNNNVLTRGHKAVAVDPSDENIAYFALSNGTITRTLNGGQSFETYATPFGTNLRARFLYIDTSSQYLFVGSLGYGMKRYDLTDNSSIDIDPSGTNALYTSDYSAYTKDGTEYLCVGAGLRISCTDDDGVTWTDTANVTADTTFYISELVVRPLANGNIRHLAYARRTNTPYGTNKLVVSNDNGATWTSVLYNITIDSVNNPTNIWSNWGDIGSLATLIGDPKNEDVFYAGTDFRVFKSTDGGVNWVEKDKGLQNIVVSDVACSPRMSSGITRCFQAGMDIGLLYTDNVGDTWTTAFPNGSNPGPQGFAVAGHIWRVVTRGTQAEWDAGTGQVVASTTFWADFIPRVIVSSDNGVTWTIVTSGLPTTQLNSSSGKHRAGWGIGYPRALAKCTDNDDILALGIDGYSSTEQGGIFISTDGGANWSRTTQPDQWKTYNGISFDPSDNSCNTIIFGEFFYNSPDLPATWRTTDRGATWTNVENDIGVYDMKFGPDGKAYKVGLDTNPMIDRSVDGINWSNMKNLNTTSQIADGLWIDDNNANRVCVGVNDGTNTGTSQGSGSDGSGEGGGSVYCTSDAQNGSSAKWYHITGDLPSPSGVTAITAVYGYQGHDWLLVGTDGSGTFRIKLDDSSRTTISSVTW